MNWIRATLFALLAAALSACTAGEACDDKHACDKGYVCSANLCVPTVAFTSDGQTVGESVGVVTVSVSLSAKSKHAVTVPYTVSGTATNPADYSIANGTFSIAAGQTVASITFNVIDDALYEPDETVIITLGTATSALASGTTVHTVTIADNDAIPTVAFAAAGKTVAESVGTVTVAVNLSAAAGIAVAVPYTVSGTATNPADHNLSNGSVTIPAGQTTANISFTVVDDAIDEADETVVLTLGTPTNATLGPTAVHAVTLTDNDAAPTVALTTASQSVAESVGTVTVTASLSAASSFTVTVPYTVSGTATNPADHNLANGTVTIPAGQTSANVTFTVVDDALYEGNETVVLTLGTPTNAALGATTVHTVTILDNDQTVAFSAPGQSVSESAGTVTVTANLSAVSGLTVTVPYTVSGTATNPADHNLANGTITIPVGSTTANVSFTVADDAIYEGNETVVLALGTPTNATIGATNNHTVTITDSNSTPTVSFATASQSVTESVGAVTVAVNLSGASAFTATVPFTVSGTATNPVDHNLANGTISFPAGQTTATVTFTVFEDGVHENEETIVCTLGAPTNANLGATAVHTVTITDNDDPWVGTRQLGSAGSDQGIGIAVDVSGNIYVTGYTDGALDGNANAGQSDVFLVKYDSDGGKQWTRQLGTSLSDYGYGVAVDVGGNVYVTGYTVGGLDGNTNAGGWDMFLVKYDGDGGKRWTRQLGSSLSDYGYGVAVDSISNIYVTGYTGGGLDGNTNAGSDDMFLVKHDGDGGKKWTRQLGTASYDWGQGIAIDVSGNIYVTGATYGGLDGNTSAGSWDVFLIKYDSDGGKQWTRQLGASGEDRGYGVAVDVSGSIYVTGYTYGGLDGNANAGGCDMFLVKFDSDGGKRWTRQFGTSSNDWGRGIAVDVSGNIYVAGYTGGGLDGNTSAGSDDMFLVKYDSDGGKRWTRQLGTSSPDYGDGVAVDVSGNPYVTGLTWGGLDGNTNAGSYDMFLVKYNSDGGKR